MTPTALYAGGVAVGLAGLWYASERVVSASLVVAKQFSVRTVVIGALFMALVTGLPELLLSIISVFNDAAQLSVGDIMGSNLIDTVVVIGTTAAVTGEVKFGRRKRKELFWLLGAVTVTMFILFGIGIIAPLAGMSLITSYLVLTVVLWRSRQGGARADASEAIQIEHETEKKHKKHIITYGIIHLILLAAATQLALYCGKELAELYNLPLEVLGATVFALATSLPEFAISIHASRRGAHGLMLGNAMGAALQQGLFTLGVLGVCARTPVTLAPVAHLQYYFAVGFALLAVCIYQRRISRIAGGFLVAIGALFIVHEYAMLVLR